VLEDGVFKICNGSMTPFVQNNDSTNSFGPEGELKPNESYELKVLFSPDRPGVYSCSLPIVINNNFDQPYYTIQVVGELLEPEIYFEPDILMLKPVPLGMQASDIVTIRQRGYKNKTQLTVQVPGVKTLDGEVVDAVTAFFASTNDSFAFILPGSDQEGIDESSKSAGLELNIRFESAKPVSTTCRLKIADDHGREFFFNVVVTADNSLFTCYSFLADHNTDYHIVLQEVKI
jgi:hypothetical protein